MLARAQILPRRQLVLPGKDYVSGWDIRWYREIEDLPRCSLTSISVGTVAFERCSDLERFALIDAEADLAGSAEVVTDASQAICRQLLTL